MRVTWVVMLTVLLRARGAFALRSSSRALGRRGHAGSGRGGLGAGRGLLRYNSLLGNSSLLGCTGLRRRRGAPPGIEGRAHRDLGRVRNRVASAVVGVLAVPPARVT